MQKKYTRKTNPINNTGYTPGYSTESNPFNIIPSENITMRNTPYPVQGTPLDENGRPIGNSIMMQPGQDYKFGGASFVFETPKFASGGTKESWISEKIAKLIREGRPQQQAVAIAYSMWEQKHANGGYQLPMYQLAGTAELDAFGQPITNGQGTTAGATNIMGQPKSTTGDATTLAGATNNTRPQLTALGEGLQPAGMAKIPGQDIESLLKRAKNDSYIDLEEEVAKKAEGEAKNKEAADAAKKEREDFEKNGTAQSTNPFGGYSMEQSIFNAGDAYQKGDAFGLAANAANVGFEVTKGFLGGMGSANVQQQQKQDYYQKQREGMTGQNRATPLGKRGGRFSTFKLGGYQLPMYQGAGLYPGEEGSYGENESMDKYVNSEQQKRAISLRAEPGSATAEETPKDYVEPAKEQTPAFDSSSARDMWVHKTGMPWSKAKELGYTTGSAQDNMKLLSELKDERFKKENLRTEAPKRKTANRKAIELQPKRLPVNINAYGIDTNAPEVIAYRNAVDKKSAEEAAKKPFGYGKPAYVNKNQAMLSGARPAVQTQSKSVMFPNYVPEGQQNPFSFYQEGGMQPGPEEQMEGQTSNPQEEGTEQQGGNQMESMAREVSQALQQGADPQKILQQLIQMGVPQEQAIQMIKAISSSPDFAIGGYFQKGGRQLFGQKPTAQQVQSVMFGNTRPQPSAVDKTFGTMEQRSAARNTLVERDMNRPSTTVMQMPLTYLQNPIKVIGDTAQYIAPGSKVANWLPNSQEDRRAILENRYDTGITDNERLRNTVNMAGEKAPMAALNVGAGMYFAGEKGVGAVANEIFNPTKQVSHVLHGQGIWSKAKNLGEVGAHHIAAHAMHQEGGVQSPQEDQMGGQIPNPQEEQGEVPQQEQMQQIMQQISQALQQGADPQQILQQLVQMGIPQDQAQQMIQMAMQELQGGQQQAPQGTPQLRRGGYYQEGGEAMDEQMEGEDEGAEGESPSMEQIEDQVEQALKQGADPQQILEQLVQMGMPQEQAIQMIQEIMQEIQGGETEMEAPEQGTPQMRAGGKYLEVLKGKTIKSYTLNKKTGNYEVQYS